MALHAVSAMVAADRLVVRAMGGGKIRASQHAWASGSCFARLFIFGRYGGLQSKLMGVSNAMVSNIHSNGCTRFRSQQH